MEVKKKNLKLMLVATFGLLLISTGITWAFFNYTRTGDANVFETGDIYFNSDYTSVTLTNVFPISKGKIETDTENVMTVNVSITGNTTYNEGVDFKIMAKDVSLQTNGKNVPISVRVTSENIPNVETFNFEDEMVVVDNSVFAQGNILPADGEVDGVVTIKAFIDKANVVISDTYDGTESDEMGTTNEFVNGRVVFTTDEWNNLESNGGVSFKIKVVAWEHEETLHDVMLANAVMDNIASDYVTSSTGINFGEISSDENGKGLYMRAGTENDAYPIVYYRGDVEDNNVLFGDFCWKAVRTTETGGVKLLYNGEGANIYDALSEDKYTIVTNIGDFTFDSTDNSWNAVFEEEVNSSSPFEISFNVSIADNYTMEISGTTPSNGSGSFTVYKDGTAFNGGGNGGGRDIISSMRYENISRANIIKLTIFGNTGITLKIKMIGDSSGIIGIGCDNKKEATQLETTSTFNVKNNMHAYSGYMFNKVYESYTVSNGAEVYFGSDFTYENGVYKLVNPTLTAYTKGYSCNSTNSTATCSTIRYYYGKTETNYHYIELSNGKSHEDAKNEIASTNDINKFDSTVKTNIETWYKNNLSNLTEKLEDIYWCNDRNGLSNDYYNVVTRVFTNKVPLLECFSVKDKFSLSNRFARINYPVGLITADEVMLAGGTGTTYNRNYYLNTENYYWTMSPYNFTESTAKIFAVSSTGNLDYQVSVSYEIGVRPSISLAHGASIDAGDGTVANPYVISEY